ncbi:hypothetical protein Q5W_09740 [Hydrogenophaga sp. PBC]|uniref:hypothetical protein n=1 Tax=Hydrogenophaga sp. PBC TaxID=795665 RepID=UPI0008540559|nr:hypothetical protein [Hydrogenophaga sp. PBC]AOS79225.1 hypothetical protein Q5W_09740 [Hydrogenophaga sp. PBC]
MTEQTRPDPLEALAGEADQLAADTAPPLGGGVTDADAGMRDAPPVATNAELVAGMVKLARDTVTQLADVQSIQTTIADDVAERLGAMWGDVLDGYGIRLSDHMGKHGKAIMAALATAAIGVNVYRGYRAEQAARAPTPSQAPAPLPDVPEA